MKNYALDSTLVINLMFSLTLIFSIFTKDLSQSPNDAIKWPESKSVKDY